MASAVGSLEYQFQVETGGVDPEVAEFISTGSTVTDVFLFSGVPQPGSSFSLGDWLVDTLASEGYHMYKCVRENRYKPVHDWDPTVPESLRPGWNRDPETGRITRGVYCPRSGTIRESCF